MQEPIAIKLHRVTFLSPGTFVSEQTTSAVDSWDTATACEMATGIVERYGARPYAFFFTTLLTAPDVPDGMGATLNVQPREVARSGLHFLDGVVVTVDDVEARKDPKEGILLSDMRNSWPIVCETQNVYKHVAPFDERDVVVDARGQIVERGDSDERKVYRSRFR